MEFLCEDSGNHSRGEGGNVEQVARTSKYILVFVFAYLSTLLYSCLYLALIFLLIFIC